MPSLLTKIFPASYTNKNPEKASATPGVSNTQEYSSVSSYMDRNYFKFLSEFTSVSNRRSEVYNDVMYLDEDELISRALDVKSEDALQIDKISGRSVTVKSSIPAIEKELSDLFKRLGVEEKAPLIVRETAKFGDKWARVYGQEGRGVTGWNLHYGPSDMVRYERDGALSAYLAVGGQERGKLLEPWDFVQFSNPGKSAILDDIRSQHTQFNRLFSEDAQYGCSEIFGARKAGKKLNLAMDSLSLARMSMGITTQIHNLEVGGATTQQALGIVAEYMAHFTRRDKTNYNSNYFKSDYDPFGFGGIVVNPTRNGKGQSTISTIGTDANISSIVDIDKMESRLFAALGIPADYLSIGSGATASNLLQLDIRYARSIMKLQRSFIIGLLHLCQIHLGWKHIEPDPSKIEIRLVSVSSINETERADVLGTMVELSQKIYDFLTQDATIDKSKILKYLTTYFLQLPNFDFKEVLEKLPTSSGSTDLINTIGSQEEFTPEVEEKILGILTNDKNARLMLEHINKIVNSHSELSAFGTISDSEKMQRALPAFIVKKAGHLYSFPHS